MNGNTGKVNDISGIMSGGCGINTHEQIRKPSVSRGGNVFNSGY